MASEDGQVVGYLLAHHYPEDAEVTGRHELWVSTVGVLPSQRGRGIASALLTRVLRSGGRRRFRVSRTGRWQRQPTGADQLYIRQGFAVVDTLVHYGLTVTELG